MSPEEYKAARVAAGLSQQKLAEMLGIDRELVNRREKGKAPLRLEAVLALSIVLEQLKRKVAASAPPEPSIIIPDVIAPDQPTPF